MVLMDIPRDCVGSRFVRLSGMRSGLVHTGMALSRTGPNVGIRITVPRLNVERGVAASTGKVTRTAVGAGGLRH